MLLTPAKLQALKDIMATGGKMNKERLEAIAALGKKAGKGDDKVVKKATVIGKPVKQPVKVVAPAPAPKAKVKTKVAPAPVVAPVNFKVENNYDVHGSQIEPKTLKKIRALLRADGIEENGYFILCPDGTGARMSDDDTNGTIAFCYRAPVKSPYPKNHRA